MDEFYDVPAAVLALEQCITDQATQPGQLIQIDMNDFQIAPFLNPKTWRVTEFNTDTSMMEEVTLRVQGILCAKLLPPVSKPINPNAMNKQRPFVRQQVNIMGYGSAQFEESVEKMIQIHIAFANNFPDDMVDQWCYGDFAGFKTLEAQTRYFDRRSTSSEQTESVPFDKLMDPDGVLQSMIGDGFYHGADNHVDYKSRMISPEGSVKYTAINPALFKVGDIVEMAISLVVYPIKNSRFKMIPMLRGLLLINQKERDKAAFLRMKAHFTSARTQVRGVKRRRDLYTNENADEETEHRMERMKIGQ